MSVVFNQTAYQKGMLFLLMSGCADDIWCEVQTCQAFHVELRDWFKFFACKKIAIRHFKIIL